jgi:hypothetical protein
MARGKSRAPKTSRVPKITRVLKVEPAGSDFTIWVLGEDGKKYQMPLAAEAIGSFIDSFEEINPTRGGQSTVRTLVALSSRAVIRPDGTKALLFRTQEAGTIAFALPDEGIRVLLRDLADLQAIQSPSTKQ